MTLSFIGMLHNALQKEVFTLYVRWYGQKHLLRGNHSELASGLRVSCVSLDSEWFVFIAMACTWRLNGAHIAFSDYLWTLPVKYASPGLYSSDVVGASFPLWTVPAVNIARLARCIIDSAYVVWPEGESMGAFVMSLMYCSVVFVLR